MKVPVYLDHHATTPCDPRVVEAMMPCFGEVFANASSRQHAPGRAAEALVDHARHQVAELLDGSPTEIVFTSGASESNNLALKGVVEARRMPGAVHVVTAVTEHKAVLDVCGWLESRGVEVTYLPVETDGRVDPDRVRSALRPQTVLVSLMLANNEIGVVHPLREVSRICRERGVLLHCDGAQALAWLDCRVDELGVDLLSLSAHKAYGPKGVGALYVRKRRPRVRLSSQIEGGGHERGRRSGTLNVPGIVGLGKACELVAERREADGERVAALRDSLLRCLRKELPDLQVHGSLEHRLPNNLHISLPGIDTDHLLECLPEVAISSGAACSSGATDTSHVVKALPEGNGVVGSTLRFGLGRTTTRDEIEFAARAVADGVRRLSTLGAPPVDACEMAC